jgi:outer membrane lipoprotein-sorting protein
MNRFLIFFLFIFSLHAHSGEVERIREYLKGLKNITADFVQRDRYGNKQYGKLYMSRPGKMRWEYKKPQELTVIINGKKVYYYDKQLDQASQYVGDKGLVNLVADEDIFNSNEVTFLKIDKHENLLESHFKTKESTDKFSFIFATDPLNFLGCVVKKDSGDNLWIKFKNLAVHNDLDPSIFKFQHSWAPKYTR